MIEVVEFLRKTELFATVPELVLSELTALMQPVELKAGETLFREGDEGDAAYLVINGILSIENDGVPVVLRKAGELVGEMALLDNTARSSDVIAAGDVQLLKLNREDFVRIFSQSRELSSNIFRMLTAKLRQHTTSHVESAKQRTMEFATPNNASGLRIKLSPGDQFAGRYTIEKKCGEGGMGIVFQAIDTILGTKVALKVLTNLNSQTLLERFKREVILARRVLHPNACRIFDIGEYGGVHYVSMEFIEGQTLAEKMQHGRRFSYEESRPILKQILSALAEIHRNGIVHRDLKPQNIMLTPNGRVCIMDFGIAFSEEEDLRMTRTGQLLGTPYYMAPEQIMGEPVDCRADLYSLGIMLYEMYTGKLPFTGSAAMSILYAHLSNPPPNPTSHVPDMPAALEQFLLRAIAKDRESRFATAEEFSQSLMSVIEE